MGLDAQEMLSELGSPPGADPVVIPMGAPRGAPGAKGSPRKPRRQSATRAPGSVRGGAADAIAGAARGLATELAVEPKEAKAPRVPSAPEWERWLGKVFYWASVLYVWWLLDGTDDEGDERVEEELKLSREDGNVIARPIAKRIAPTLFNKRWGRAVLDSDDMFEAFLVLGSYVLTTRKAFRRRVQMGRVIPGPWNDRNPNVEASNGQAVPTGSSQGGPSGVAGSFGSGRVPVFSGAPEGN